MPWAESRDAPRKSLPMRDAAAPHTLFGNREALIQRYIQQKHIHARLAEESPIRTLSELRDELLYFIRRNAARLCDARRLCIGE